VEAITDPGLVLKVTPPKLRKTLLVRERLRRLGAADQDAAVIVVEAPAGYGKTSLIAQWRLDWLQGGAAVGWLSLDAGDSPVTLASGIALGLRRSIGRRDFGADAIELVRRGAGTMAALTALLAEITEDSRPMVVVFDNGERLVDAEAVDVLDYLLHNLPPNLRVVIGTRSPARAETLDLLGQGALRRVTAADLAFDVNEAIQLLTARLGGRVDSDQCARLHDVTRGWPLGLQLAAAALEHAADLRRTIEEFSKSRDDATQHLLASLVDSLPDRLADFLTRCALLDSLHPSLCEAVTGEDDAALSLQRLVFETPLLSATEGGEWLRLHPLAREYLHSRAERILPEPDRREIHRRAWRWLEANQYPERAAQHALAAGFRSEALALISSTLIDEVEQGHHGNVVDWLAQIPRDMLESNVQLRVIKLWSDAHSKRVAVVERDAALFLDDPSADDATRNEVRVVLACALFIADRRDEACRHVAECEDAVQNRRTREVLAGLKAHTAFDSGETELARQYLRALPDEEVLPAAQIWRDALTGLTYLLEGRPLLAEQSVRAQHERWATRVGRRALWVVHVGSALAAACWQQDRRDEAKALLADRLDAIEQLAGFRFVIHAYLTLARLAACAGDDTRAVAYLESLAALGERDGVARFVAVSLAERVRLHAARGRPTQAVELLDKLRAVVDRAVPGELRTLHLVLELEVAGTITAAAADDRAGAVDHVARALELATRLNRGYEVIQALALRALLAERAGESPVVHLVEALSRAESGGLVRVFADTLPDLTDLVRRHAHEIPASAVTRRFIERVLAAAESTEASDQQPVHPARSALLTPKEDQVLRLLAGGLPNKRIATELELSSDTVKWHVKKLLAKLDAGSREHAVDRARMLGLLR